MLERHFSLLCRHYFLSSLLFQWKWEWGFINFLLLSFERYTRKWCLWCCLKLHFSVNSCRDAWYDFEKHHHHHDQLEFEGKTSVKSLSLIFEPYLLLLDHVSFIDKECVSWYSSHVTLWVIHADWVEREVNNSLWFSLHISIRRNNIHKRQQTFGHWDDLSQRQQFSRIFISVGCFSFFSTFKS